MSWPLSSLTAMDWAVYVVGAGASVWLSAKVLRAVVHYAFPSIIPGETNTVLLASPRTHSSTPVSVKDLENVTEYDYIVVGTGTAGCVIANRLTEDSSITVLAIESGHSDTKQIFSRIPAGFGRLFKSAADYNLRTTSQANAGGRAMQWPRGKMLGGCSAINAMIFNKGPPDDFDEWERLGNKGWGFKDVEPFMKKAECFKENDAHHLSAEELEQHGRSGPWQVGYSHQSKFTPKFLDGCEAQGIPKVSDINSNKGINGATRFQTFIDSKGQRSSAAVAYLTEDVASRSNLKIAVGQTVTRIIFDESGSEPKAVGVEMASSRSSPVRYLARAKREIIVCAGAVHTPQILKLSGLGPAKELTSKGIKVIRDMPAVGANMADHLDASIVCKIPKGLSIQYLLDPWLSLPPLLEWFRYGTGPMTSCIAEAAAFLRTVDREDAPASLRNNDLTSGKTSSDLEILMTPMVNRAHGSITGGRGDFATFTPILLRPESRGTVTLASSDPFDPPAVDANYLSTKHDVDLMLYGLQLSRRIAHSTGAFVEWSWPSATLDDTTDDQMIEHIRNTSETIYHPMCTARMGRDPRESVVDAELRVHGVRGLRVADASVFATPLACHPCAPVIMVGEKAADIIKRAAAA